jgi:hypothetical protein
VDANYRQTKAKRLRETAHYKTQRAVIFRHQPKPASSVLRLSTLASKQRSSAIYPTPQVVIFCHPQKPASGD